MEEALRSYLETHIGTTLPWTQAALQRLVAVLGPEEAKRRWEAKRSGVLNTPCHDCRHASDKEFCWSGISSPPSFLYFKHNPKDRRLIATLTILPASGKAELKLEKGAADGLLLELDLAAPWSEALKRARKLVAVLEQVDAHITRHVEGLLEEGGSS